jgi:cell division septation protein DedD
MREAHGLREKIELQLDNRQIVSFVIGSLVVLGVVFALGVMVGKQLATAAVEPPKSEDPLATIDAKEQVRAVPASVQGTGELQKSKEVGLSFADELTKAKPANPLAEPMRSGPSPAPRADPKPEAKPEPRPPPAAPEPAKRKGGLAGAFEKAALKPSPGEGFSLQVSSFPSRADAAKVVTQLSDKGFNPYIAEADVAGKGHLFRVRIGPYPSRDAAEGALQALKKKSALPAIIISPAHP